MSPWVKLSDGFDVDWRIESVSDEATGLFVKACTFTGRELTDGRIPGRWLERKVLSKKTRDRIVAELLAVGLMRRDGPDYLIGPVVDNDPTDRLVGVFMREEVRAHREKEREKKAAQRQRRSASQSLPSTDVPTGHPEGHPWDSRDVPWYGYRSGSGEGTREDVDGEEAASAGAREGGDDAYAEAARIEARFPDIAHTNGNNPPRADVEALCALHAELIENNTSTRPEPSADWFNDFRRLLDDDKRPSAEARRLLRWVHCHTFWASRTLKPEAFRRNYEAIKLQELEGESPIDGPLPDVNRRDRLLSDAPYMDPDEWIGMWGHLLQDVAGWDQDRIAEAALTRTGQRLAEAQL
jgi:hypothetical protein